MMDKIKIVYLCALYGNPYIESLSNYLQERNCDVEIKDNYFQLLFLPELILKSQPDILHFHTLHSFFPGGRFKVYRLLKFCFFIIQIVILKILNVKIFWTVHEWQDRVKKGKDNIPLKWAIILGKLFDGIITHSSGVKQEIIEAFEIADESKVVAIAHGNYINTYQNQISLTEARSILNIELSKVVFLLFGNIHYTKGFLEAIDTFKRLEENTESFLLVVGNPAEENIEATIAAKIKSDRNILFVPRKVKDEEIQIYMKAANCVILPYKVFTTSGTAILAMSFAKACIAPQAGYFEETLDDNGTLFYHPTNEQGLLLAMKKAILNGEKLKNMGEHNFQLAKALDWKSIAAKTFDLYQK